MTFTDDELSALQEFLEHQHVSYSNAPLCAAVRKLLDRPARLPTVNIRQQQMEDARDLHEQLWANWCLGRTERIVIPYNGDDPEKRQRELSGNLKRFWTARGFRFHTKQTATGIALWLGQGHTNGRTDSTPEQHHESAGVPPVPSPAVDQG